ncbi:MAG: ankyrin repeat domain-containing protein [Segniliparus sp.]|uniref:ankyrin repeat domain-containing protein n=1 Tax=Segniliparus sp. TaxID=2804064 RepID=UPI003F3AC8D5
MNVERDQAGRVPLHYAPIDTFDIADATRGLPVDERRRVEAEFRLKQTRKLIEAGADVNARDNEEWTPLHFAARSINGVEVVRALLDAGADIEAENSNGNSPLYEATVSNWSDPKTIALLLSRGADPRHANRIGQSPLSYIQQPISGGNFEEIKSAFGDLANEAPK